MKPERAEPGEREGTLLDVARTLAELADPIALRHFGGPVASVAKPDGSPVTAADQAIEAALRSALADLRPDDAILGEEQGGHIDPDRVTWVIDPIDATKNYLRGIPVFATLIGAVADNEITVGVVSAPALGERWEAARGRGACRNGEQVGVSAIAEISRSHLLHGGIDHHRALDGGWERLGQLASMAWRLRGFGDFWGHLLVAGGMAEACFEPQLSPWDVVAPACVVTEAGGRVSTWEGGSVIHGGSVLSSNGLVHEAVACVLTG
jgi:histidinol-phosphatase